ncbi:hypothetical protein ACFC9T_05335, partial [Enterococcus faecium]
MSIYTCTMNLAIDLFIETEEMHPFMVNRTKEDDIQANGKGVNVSLVLKMLGFPSTALGGMATVFLTNFIRCRTSFRMLFRLSLTMSLLGCDDLRQELTVK